jgi:Fur family iron response transcriptional regulator
MEARNHIPDSAEIARRFRRLGVAPTAQRLQIAGILFARPAHFSADELFRQASETGIHVSKATVYNTLRLFVRKGLVREVMVDPARVFYDSNTGDHHHFYNVVTGDLLDVGAEALSLDRIPSPPPGTEIEGVEVILRLRPKS